MKGNKIIQVNIKHCISVYDKKSVSINEFSCQNQGPSCPCFLFFCNIGYFYPELGTISKMLFYFFTQMPDGNNYICDSILSKKIDDMFQNRFTAYRQQSFGHFKSKRPHVQTL